MKAIFITLLLTAVSALPSSLQQRDCAYFYQPFLNQITQHQPDQGSPTVTTPFTVRNDIGKKDEVVSFRYIPGGSYGCELQFDYHPDRNPIVDIEAGDPTVINVYRLSDGGNFPYVPTWNNTAPRMGPLVGTWKFPSGADASVPKVIPINSFACDGVMTFRFTIANENARGGVSIAEDATSGLRMAYNC